MISKDTRNEIEYKLKVLFAWKELSEEKNNTWAANTALKHIIDLQRKLYV